MHGAAACITTGSHGGAVYACGHPLPTHPASTIAIASIATAFMIPPSYALTRAIYGGVQVAPRLVTLSTHGEGTCSNNVLISYGVTLFVGTAVGGGGIGRALTGLLTDDIAGATSSESITTDGSTGLDLITYRGILPCLTIGCTDIGGGSAPAGGSGKSTLELTTRSDDKTLFVHPASRTHAITANLMVASRSGFRYKRGSGDKPMTS